RRCGYPGRATVRRRCVAKRRACRLTHAARGPGLLAITISLVTIMFFPVALVAVTFPAVVFRRVSVSIVPGAAEFYVAHRSRMSQFNAIQIVQLQPTELGRVTIAGLQVPVVEMAMCL
ncbi:MAG: hypothetical protein WDZ50_02335, partial [Woeseia sp.]